MGVFQGNGHDIHVSYVLALSKSGQTVMNIGTAQYFGLQLVNLVTSGHVEIVPLASSKNTL